MEFRIVYRGPLPAQGSKDSRAKEKQSIRKVLHPQLKEFWSQHRDRLGDPSKPPASFECGGFQFCPVVRKPNILSCAMNILFLRRDNPGNLIKSGGDIDNRIKVLLDGLRMPQRKEETAGAVPEEDEVPFFCLLEDDSLVTELRVTTDRLLVPASADERTHDVVLVIHVVSTYATPTMEEFAWTQRYALRAHLDNMKDR